MVVRIDPTSRGARLTAKATLPLREVATAPGGLTIYAARDEHSDGRRYVQFVVAPSEETPLLHVGFRLRSTKRRQLGPEIRTRPVLVASRASPWRRHGPARR